MPARRRGQEARRATRRASTRATADAPLTVTQQIDAAYAELENPWCCPDCDPHHPANTDSNARDEIAAYQAALSKEAP